MSKTNPQHFSPEWLHFLNEIESAKVSLKFGENEECFYRGHTHSSHSLLPGLFRQLSPDTKHIPKKLLETEGATFFEFRSKAKDVHKSDLSNWDILFYMQHHGCKTRLLDWTEHFAVALHFSLKNFDQSQTSPTIWMLNAYALNEIYLDWRDLYSPEYLEMPKGKTYVDFLIDNFKLKWNKPIGLYPIRKVDRLTTQGGYFTIHGNEVQSIDKIVPAQLNIWKKITLDKNAVRDARRFLDLAGINEFTLFPDLDGLARYLNNKYFK